MTRIRKLAEAPWQTLRVEEGVPALALTQTPEHRTALDNHPVLATAYVWCDFMPAIPENPSRLHVTVTVEADGPGILPLSLRADRVVALHRGEVWVAPLDESSRTSRTLRAQARVGPRWETDTIVDLVVRLTTSAAVRLVKIPRLTIERTE